MHVISEIVSTIIKFSQKCGSQLSIGYCYQKCTENFNVISNRIPYPSQLCSIHSDLGIEDAVYQKYEESLERVEDSEQVLKHSGGFVDSKKSKHPGQTKDRE